MKRKIFAVLLTGAMLTAGLSTTVFADGEKTFVYGTTGYSEEMGDAGLNPHDNYSGWSALRYGVGETLFKYNDNMEVEPWLATDYEFVDDTTVKITLRDGVKFSSGRAMDAEAVKECLEDLIAVHDRAPYDLKIDHIEADGLTLTIYTTEPCPAIINYLGDPYGAIIDMDYGIQGEGGSANVAGTGPYIAEKVTPTQIDLVKNDNYWGGEVNVDKITVKSFADGSALTAALQTGDIQGTYGLQYDNYALFDGNPDYQISSVATSRCFFGQFNMDSEIVQDQNVRKAIEMGIDKEGFCSVIMEGRGIPAKGAFPGSFSYGNDAVETVSYDPEEAKKLADAFWPGPLTMILPRRDCVPLRTTGGLDTVGVRCPDHPVTRAIIAAADTPVAAPSGNTSGRPSPTCARHMMEDMMGKIDGIVDGGPCAVGVESTIIDLTVQPPRLLRPGGLPLEALEAVLGEVAVDKAVRQKLSDGEKAKAPGMKYRHYAPRAAVTVVTGAPRRSAAYIAAHLPAGAGVICFDEYAPLFAGHIVHRLGPAGDKLAQAQRVFDALRTFDETEVTAIYAQCPDEAGLGLAVSNRLKKAAGFHTVDVSPLVIGFTGPTGAGKTSALRALEQLGGLVLDCDAIYHELLRTDGALRGAIAGAFGPVFAADGGLDRQKLGNLVFGDPAALETLNGIIYARLPRELRRRMDESDAAVVGIDAINLIESGLDGMCRRTVAVIAPAETRVVRIMARDGIPEEYARLRVRAQKDEAFYRARCTDVLVNDCGSAAAFTEKARQALETILKEERA